MLLVRAYRAFYAVYAPVREAYQEQKKNLRQIIPDKWALNSRWLPQSVTQYIIL
jgi:hypothetical protein